MSASTGFELGRSAMADRWQPARQRCLRRGGCWRRGGGWPPLALVSAGRDADDPLEVPDQMGLISKAGLGSDRGGRRARVEQRAGAAHPQLVEVGIRWQPGLVAEGTQQRERAESRLARQIIET